MGAKKKSTKRKSGGGGGGSSSGVASPAVSAAGVQGGSSSAGLASTASSSGEDVSAGSPVPARRDPAGGAALSVRLAARAADEGDDEGDERDAYDDDNDDDDDDNGAYETVEYVAYEEVEEAYHRVVAQSSALAQAVADRAVPAARGAAEQLQRDVDGLVAFVPRLAVFDAPAPHPSAHHADGVPMTVFEPTTPVVPSTPLVPTLFVFTPDNPGDSALAPHHPAPPVVAQLEAAARAVRDHMQQLVGAVQNVVDGDGEARADEDSDGDVATAHMVDLLTASRDLFNAMKESSGLLRVAADEEALAATVVSQPTLSEKRLGKHRRIHSNTTGMDVKVVPLVSVRKEPALQPIAAAVLPPPLTAAAVVKHTAPLVAPATLPPPLTISTSKPTTPTAASASAHMAHAEALAPTPASVIDELLTKGMPLGQGMEEMLADIERLSNENGELQGVLKQTQEAAHELQQKQAASEHLVQKFQDERDQALSEHKAMAEQLAQMKQQLDAQSRTMLVERGRYELELERQRASSTGDKHELNHLREANRTLKDTVMQLQEKLAATSAPSAAPAPAPAPAPSSSNADWEYERKVLQNDAEMLRLANKRLEVSRHELIQALGKAGEFAKLEELVGKDMRKFFTTVSPAAGLSGIVAFVASRVKQIETTLEEIGDRNPLAKADLESVLSLFRMIVTQTAPYAQTVLLVEQSYTRNDEALRNSERALRSLQLQMDERDKHIENLTIEREDLTTALEELKKGNERLKAEKYELQQEAIMARRTAIEWQGLCRLTRAKLARLEGLPFEDDDVKAEMTVAEMAALLPGDEAESDALLTRKRVRLVEPSEDDDSLDDRQTADDLLAVPKQPIDLMHLEIPSPVTDDEVVKASPLSALTPLMKAHTPRLDFNKEEAVLLLQRVWRGHIARKYIKKVVARKHIAREIYETEKSYVKHIMALHDVFMLNLKKRIGTGGNAVITKEQFDALFYQVPEILELNRRLEAQIQQRVDKWYANQTIGNIFVEASGPLEVYTFFVNNYNRALAALHECRNNPAFRTYYNELKALQGRRSLELADLLIMPIQRTPRYLLLLQTLLGKTRPNHPDHANLVAAIESLKHTVAIIDAKKGESERYQKVVELQQRVTGLPSKFEPLAKGQDRYWTKDGDVYEQSSAGSGAKERRLMLFSDILICCKPANAGRRWSIVEANNFAYEFKWGYPLLALRDVNGTGAPDPQHKDKDGQTVALYPIVLTFQGERVREKRMLNAPTETDRAAWVSELEKAIKAWSEFDGHGSEVGLDRSVSSVSMVSSMSVVAQQAAARRTSILTTFGRYDGEAKAKAIARQTSGDTVSSSSSSGASIASLKDVSVLQEAIAETRSRVSQLKKEISTESNLAKGLVKIAGESVNKAIKSKVSSQLEDVKKKQALLHKQLLAEEYKLEELVRKQRSFTLDGQGSTSVSLAAPSHGGSGGGGGSGSSSPQPPASPHD